MAAVNAGWSYFSQPGFYDLDKAIRLTQCEKSAELIMRAYAKNNLGNMYQLTLEENSENVAIEYYKAAELFVQQDYKNPWPFENLARFYIINRRGERQFSEARRWAELSIDNDGGGIFVHLLTNIPSIRTQNTKLIMVGCSMKQNWGMRGVIGNLHPTLRIP